MQVDREEFLSVLERVRPGLSTRDIVEQSSCFVFQDGEVMTFNDEVAVRAPVPEGITGAVQAAPLLAVLSKMPEDKVDLSVEEEELVVVGKRRKAGIRREKEVALPVHLVEKPAKWKPVHEDFTDAVTMVQDCAGKDETRFSQTCVNVAPEWMEACDNFQLARYFLKTGLKESTLVKKESLKHVVGLGPVKLSLTDSWIHFKGSGGVVLSCRRYVEEYNDLDPLIKLEKATPMNLPKGIAAAAEKAELFSAENADNNLITVELREGKVKVKGVGLTGWYTEFKSVSYKGPRMSFLIAPALLIQLVKRHNQCVISSDRIKVDGGKFVYVSCLGQADEAEGE
jgi:hypothetical protein